MRDVVGWPYQPNNLQVDWKVRDQLQWETETAVGWAMDGNLENEAELWFTVYLAPLSDPEHTALEDFLRESQCPTP